ncbi:hypothetical protein HYALB_00001529 [Hymenoscyphus albidus]|uniref:Uncharacterized protein n=1 Tax=Hymenoscyphus albidus TaxID=595503 RepID=A0A9N9LFP6_9HELO|nr:hypothetical protein HYALB_00001529 [Hymenoscyphus albidus]
MPPIDYKKAYSVQDEPVPVLIPEGQSLTMKEQMARMLKLLHQKRTYQFYTQELIDLDIHSDRTLKTPTLGNPVAPMFQRENWLTQERLSELRGFPSYPNPRQELYNMTVNYPLPYEGKWEANNPDIWNVLKPSL